MNLYHIKLLQDRNFYPDKPLDAGITVDFSLDDDTKWLKFQYRKNGMLVRNIELSTLPHYCGALYLSNLVDVYYVNVAMPNVFRALELGGYTRAYCQIPDSWGSTAKALEKWGWKPIEGSKHENIRTGNSMTMWCYDVPWNMSTYSIDQWLSDMNYWASYKKPTDVSRFKESKLYKEFFSEA